MQDKGHALSSLLGYLPLRVLGSYNCTLRVGTYLGSGLHHQWTRTIIIVEVFGDQ